MLVPTMEYQNARLDEMTLDNYPRFEPNKRLPYSKPRKAEPANAASNDDLVLLAGQH